MGLRRVLALIALSAPVIVGGACSKKSGGSGGGGDDGSTPGTVQAGGPGNGGSVAEPSYKPTTTPTKISPTVPGTIAVEAGALRLKMSDDTNVATPQKSEGYVQLRATMLDVGEQLADLALNIYLFDSVLPTLKAQCASLPCTASGVKAVLTAEMAEGVIYAAGGKALLTAAVEKEISDQIGDEVSLGTVTLKAPAANSGFDTCVEVLEDATYKTAYCYSRTVISADTRYIDGDSVGSYALKYDQGKDTLSMVYEEIIGHEKHRDSFKLQGNPNAIGANGIIAEFDLKGYEPDNGSWSSKLKVLADDGGGIVDTDYFWETQTISAFSTSAPTTNGTIYYALPTSAGADASIHEALAYVEGHGTDDTTNYVYYFGPATVPASMKLFAVGPDDADGLPTLTDSGLTATLALTTDRNDFYYLEEFGPTGNLVYLCSKTVKALSACDYEEGTRGVYTTAYLGTGFGFGNAQLVVILGGAGANAAAFGGDTFYVMPGATDLSAQSPNDVGYVLPDMLAWGIFGGDYDNLSTTSMEGYETEVFAGQASEFGGSRVWKVAYTSGGDPYFAEVTNVSVTTGP